MTESAIGRPRLLVWGELTVATLLGTAAFALTGMVIVWVIAGIAGGWLVCRSLRWAGRSADPSNRVRLLGQLLVGAALGPVLATQDFATDALYLPGVLLGVLAILGGSVLTAYWYARWARLDGLTAGLATLPGGLAIMPSVAAEHQRPPGLVALVQSARVAAVICAVAVLAPMLSGVSAQSTTALTEVPQAWSGWLFWGALLAVAFLSARLARRLRVPVPALLGPMFAAAALTLTLRAFGADLATLHVPLLQEVVGQLLLGVTVGEYLSQRAQRSVRQVVGGITSVLATFVLSVAIAAVIAPLTPWSFLTCLLVVAPGGAPEMVVVAAAVGADLQVVVLAQTVRQVAVNGLMPVWIRFFRRWDPGSGHAPVP